MKKTIVTTVVLMALVIGAFTSLAQSPTRMPDVLAFLSSRAALRAYAIESARHANLNIESAGMQGSWGTGSSWESPLESRAILEIINGWRFVFTMENPADYVHATAEIKNMDWDTLFAAQAWQTPELVSTSSYRLPELYFYFEKMAELIPFKVDRSIQWGQLKYLNEDGKTITTIDLEVRNGKVYFRSDFAGKGILVLRDDTGHTFLYNLRNGGVQIPVANVQYTGSQSWIDNLFPFNNPSAINHRVWSWDGIGQNPTFEVIMNSGAWVPVRTYSNEGAEAIGFQVRPQGGTNWVHYPIVPPAKYVPIPLKQGVNYVVPVWNPDEFREPDPALPVPTSPTVSGGGGKG